MEQRKRVTLDDAVFADNLRARRPIQRPTVRVRAMDGLVMYKRVVPVYAKPTVPPKQHVVPVERAAVELAAAMIAPPEPPVVQAEPVAAPIAPTVDRVTEPKVSKLKRVVAAIKHTPAKLKSQGLVSNAFMAFAVLMIVGGAVVLFKYHKATSEIISAKVNAQSASADTAATQPGVPTTDEGVKDEKPVPSGYVYKVDPNSAQSVSIPSIGAFGYIRNVGTTKTGAMATPSSIFWGGWSTAGSLPGQSGLSILNGHVSGPTSPGIFYKLNKVNVGDLVKIKKGDGSTVTYKVVAKESVAVDDATNKLYQMRGTGVSQLNIITCDGKFDGKSDSFKNRMIVYTDKM